jgi:hypothetical protein
LLLTIAAYRVSRVESRKFLLDDVALAPIKLPHVHAKP